MYISPEQRKKADESVTGIDSVTSLSYEITMIMLSMWNSRPTDETIALITQELVVDPKHSKFIGNLRAAMSPILTVAQVYTACRIAYDEFYQRIVRLHHAVQCRENGDIEGYTQAMKPLLDKLGSEIKKEAASQIIVPGK